MSTDHPVLCDASGNHKLSGAWEDTVGTVLLLSLDAHERAESMAVSYLCQSQLRLQLSGPPPEPGGGMQALALTDAQDPPSLLQQHGQHQHGPGP